MDLSEIPLHCFFAGVTEYDAHETLDPEVRSLNFVMIESKQSVLCVFIHTTRRPIRGVKHMWVANPLTAILASSLGSLARSFLL